MPSSTVVPQQNYENSVSGSPNQPVCNSTLPETAIMSSGLSPADQAAVTGQSQGALANSFDSLQQAAQNLLAGLGS